MSPLAVKLTVVLITTVFLVICIPVVMHYFERKRIEREHQERERIKNQGSQSTIMDFDPDYKP